MLKTPPNYEEEYKKVLESNRSQVISDLEAGRLEEKIEKRCKKYGYDERAVKNKIKTEPMIADTFATDPAKQNIYEKVAASFIRSLDAVEGFEKLGTNKLSVSNGGIIRKSDLTKSGGQAQAKTIDFSWKSKGKNFYASHKYTKESGGAQNHQYEGLKKFLEEANKSIAPKNYFIAIADGDFYRGTDATVRKTRMQRLKDFANSAQKVFAMPISELEEFLTKLEN